MAALFLAVAALLAATADGPVPVVALAGETTVAIDTALRPAVLTIPPGTTVTWANIDTLEHRVRSTSGPAPFDSGDLRPGQSFSRTLTAEGTYRYRDGRNRANTAYFGTIVVSAAATVPGGSGGGSTPGTGTPPGPAAPATASVQVADFSFTPREVTVSAGGTVTWRNSGKPHTATANSLAFDSGIMANGGVFSFTFASPGTYPYVCDLHSQMVGTVRVVDAAGSAPPPAPPPTTPPGGGGGSSSPPASPAPPPPVPPGGASVQVLDFKFSPATVTVAPGGTVIWAEVGAVPHTVTADDGSFDSGFLARGQTFSYTFASVGSYSYTCFIHPTMVGTVTVSTTSTAGANADVPAGANQGKLPPIDSAPPRPGPTPTAAAVVRMLDFEFSPRELRIAGGESVAWVNAGQAPHSATARDFAFESGLVTKGGTYTRRFATPGTYAYFCTIHPEMVATLIVGQPASAPGVPAPTPAAGAGPPSGGSEADGGPAADRPLPRPPELARGIQMLDFAYVPGDLVVTAGAIVVWFNSAGEAHTVTLGDGSSDSGPIAPGATYARLFADPGSFPYFCTLHPGITGTVTVLGSLARSQPAASDEPATPRGEPDAAVVLANAVQLGDNLYTPARLVVAAGTTISWVNTALSPHTVTAIDHSFDSGPLDRGVSFSLTFATPGTYPYFCTLHPEMAGIVEVTGERAGPASMGGEGEPGTGAPDAAPGTGTGRGRAWLVGLLAVFAGGAVTAGGVALAWSTSRREGTRG